MKEYRAHISAHKRQVLLRAFVSDVDAVTAGESAKVNKNTAKLWYRYFRECIFESDRKVRRFSGEVECDQSFFGASGRRRFKLIDGVKVLLPRQKFLVFGFLQRSAEGTHRVRTYIIKRADARTLMPLIRLVVEPGARIYTDMWRSFNGLEKDGYTHRTVNHRKKQFSKNDREFKVHTGTIDEYFKQSKARLVKFRRLHPTTIELHLSECAFRYNHRHDFGEALRSVIKQHEIPASYTTKANREVGPSKKVRS